MAVVAICVAVQIVLVVAYFLVERTRRPEAVFATEPLDEPAPGLTAETRSGAVDLAALGDQPVLVHFWATWCVPCREELPGLVEAARTADLRLLAVTDEPWDTVATFFHGEIPSGIVRDPVGDAARRFGVSGLPDTFLIARGGRIVTRIGGARDWSGRKATAFLRSASAR